MWNDPVVVTRMSLYYSCVVLNLRFSLLWHYRRPVFKHCSLWATNNIQNSLQHERIYVLWLSNSWATFLSASRQREQPREPKRTFQQLLSSSHGSTSSAVQDGLRFTNRWIQTFHKKDKLATEAAASILIWLIWEIFSFCRGCLLTYTSNWKYEEQQGCEFLQKAWNVTGWGAKKGQERFKST